jgi:hypothetical protein
VVTLVSKSAPAGAGSSGMATVRRQARLQTPPQLMRRILLHLHGPSSCAVLVEILVPVVQQVGQNKRMSKWVYVWRSGAELAFRFGPNPINRSHAPFPGYPISPARRALSSRMWRSACSGSSRRQSPCHVDATGHAGGRAMATHLRSHPTHCAPSRPVSSCPGCLRPGRTQGGPSLPGAISGRSRLVCFLPGGSWLPTVTQTTNAHYGSAQRGGA